MDQNELFKIQSSFDEIWPEFKEVAMAYYPCSCQTEVRERVDQE